MAKLRLQVAKFITKLEADANIRNEKCSNTLDTVQYGVDEDGKDGSKGLLARYRRRGED